MIAWLDARNPHQPFPPAEAALHEPNGLLAAGGSLAPARLLNGYRQGIFPWYGKGQPILWWSPDPRTIFLPDRLRISHSLRKVLRSRRFVVTVDHAFARVVDECAAPRPDAPESWITREMREAYGRLHALGHAHSVETWRDGQLVGGLYGVALGGVFFGESMFSRSSDASKVALVHLGRLLVQRGFGFIDCQLETSHLLSLGAQSLPRPAFLKLLHEHVYRPMPDAPWTLPPELCTGW